MKLKGFEIGMFEIGERMSRRDVYVLDCGDGINPDIEETVRNGYLCSNSITAYRVGGYVIAFYETGQGFFINCDGRLRRMSDGAVAFLGSVKELAEYLDSENLLVDSEDNSPRVVGEVEVEI